MVPVLKISKNFIGSATGSVVNQINGLAGGLNKLATDDLVPVQEALNKLI